MDCVIVGGGAAGFQAAFSARKRWPDKTVALLDAETETGYYRTLLPQFIVDTVAESKLFFPRPGEDPMLTVRSGVAVKSLDRTEQLLHPAGGETLHYKRLVLACGGRPIVPPICPGTECSGVFPVRYLAAARAAKKWIPDHPQIVVLGGGLVGVKTAAHLAHAGLDVTVIEKENGLLPQALSPAAAAPVKAHLERLGIKVVLECSVDEVISENRLLKAVRAGSQWIPCQTLLVAAGSVPDVGFLEGSGLLENGKLVVSADLRTLDEKIYAIGDAVFIKGDDVVTPWTWPQAVCQGKLAGCNIFDPNPAPLKALSRVNAMNLFGLSLVILGVPIADSETIAYGDPGRGVYREVFVKGGRIVGGAIVGDISGAGRLHALIVSGQQVGKGDPDFLKPRLRAFSHHAWDAAGRLRRARFLPA